MTILFLRVGVCLLWSCECPSLIRFHWLYTIEYKWECRDAVRKFIALVKNWWNLPIRAFHYDNEKSAGVEVEIFLNDGGIIDLHNPPYPPEQNGPSERSGGVILRMARRPRIESQLPNQLWPEMVSAAVWILNRIPTYLKDENSWIIPWQEARRDFGGERMKKTNQANMRIYGWFSLIPTAVSATFHASKRCMTVVYITV